MPYTATNNYAIAHALHNIHSHKHIFKWYINSCKFFNSLEEKAQNTKMPLLSILLSFS